MNILIQSDKLAGRLTKALPSLRIGAKSSGWIILLAVVVAVSVDSGEAVGAVTVPDWAVWVGTVAISVKSVFEYLTERKRVQDQEREEKVKRLQKELLEVRERLDGDREKWSTEREEFRDEILDLSQKLATAEAMWDAAVSTELPVASSRGKPP